MNDTAVSNDEILLAEYSLGLLETNELAQAHALMSSDDAALATALQWEERFLSLVDVLVPIEPSPLLLQRIQTSLGHDVVPAMSTLYRQPDKVAAKSAGGTAEDAVKPTEAHGNAARRHSRQEPASRVEPTLTQEDAVIDPVTTDGTSPVSPQPSGQTSEPVKTTASPRGRLPEKGRSSVGQRVEPRNSGQRAQPSIKVQPGPSNSESRQPLKQHSAPSPRVEPRPVPPTPLTGGATQSEAAKQTSSAPSTSQAYREEPGAAALASTRRLGRKLAFWRIAAVLFGAAAVVLAFLPKAPPPPAIHVTEIAPRQGAILQAPGQSSTPGWVVTVDYENNVLMQPLVRSDIASDASVQLWTQSPRLGQPRSLGLIDPNLPVTVPAGLIGELSPGQVFEMTLEPEGGSPSASPSGPVLFIGRMVEFGPPKAANAGAVNDAAENRITG